MYQYERIINILLIWIKRKKKKSNDFGLSAEVCTVRARITAIIDTIRRYVRKKINVYKKKLKVDRNKTRLMRRRTSATSMEQVNHSKRRISRPSFIIVNFLMS